MAGEDGPIGLDFEDARAAYLIGSIALAVILFDSGFSTPFRAFRAAAAPAVTLSTLGVVLTTAIVGAIARYLLEIGWVEAFLIGAIVSSTDAAAVFFLLRTGGITIRDKVKSTLEVESGTNDPMAIFLTITLVEALVAGTRPDDLTWILMLEFAQQFGVGLGVGLLGGLLIVQCVNRVEFDQGLYPILVLGMALLTFAAASMFDGSGFLAAYVAGLLAGNWRLRAVNALYRFQLGMTWLGQMTMFLALGLFATPSEFPELALHALALALVLTFLARPLAIWICLAPFGFSARETTFVAWVGLRGAVSILLGITPIIAGLPFGQDYFNIAFLIVVISLLVQGWTIKPMARRLGLVVPTSIGPMQRYELDLPGSARQELVAYRIHPESPVGSGARVPRWARPALIVRDSQSLDIHNAGRLRPGDMVYIFAAPKHVRLLDRLFAARAKLELTDRDFFGDFSIHPNVRLTDVAHAYGIKVNEQDQDLRVKDLLHREFRDQVQIGDRMRYGPVEFIVRNLDDNDAVSDVGIAVEPTRPAAPVGPILRKVQRVFEILGRRRSGDHL